ncbi:GLPGLI family protein [Bergeyella zoohelcum]|uniref:GLPGLI family protein n=1 Tax=Bergeyella zoohelcum TaxID=1015 RepID=UPI002A90B025|nr:GLPGLI family protein [Bergeyella zoohelcum]MDY6025984.1 GLPGLI family protein [Bergeyella zoohelcum]
MNKKKKIFSKFILLCVLFGVCSGIFGQNLKVTYCLDFIPNAKKPLIKREIFQLHTSSEKKMSVYKSFSRMISDSLYSEVNAGKPVDESHIPQYATKDFIIKSYIDKDIKHYYHFNSSYFALKRRISFQWKVIPNETKRILDYLCKKAITSFGGRDWEVWYSPDIPVHDGPYVFGQLPGLILEVKSADGEYHYQAIGLQEERKDIIIEKKVAWVKDREHLIRLKKDYIKSPSATARQEDLQYGISGAVVNGQKIDLEEGYRLLDRELWDWMEENNNSIEKDDIWVR